MSGRWEKLDGFDRIELIPQLERVAEQALAAEPENMELHFAIARFYRAAASNNPELIDSARFHTVRGAELGPNTISARNALAAQTVAEDALASKSLQG